MPAPLRLPIALVLVAAIAAGLCACAGSVGARGGERLTAARALATSPPPSAATGTQAPAAATSVPLTAAVSREPGSPAGPPSVPNAGARGEADPYFDVMTEQGQRARGLYFNAPMARRLGARGVAAMVLGAGLDAAVIDLKDGEGRVSYDSALDDLAGSERVYLKDPPAFLRELKAAGVYAIARIVCFSDPSLPRAFPERAVMDGRPGHAGDIWMVNAKRNTWLDPYNEVNHETIAGIAKEAEAMGFDEIQLDYVRFPVDVATKFAVFPAQSDKPRKDVLLGLLARVDAAVHIPLGADVFGLTAFKKGDRTGMLGQDLEAWTQYIDVFSPMLYVAGMREWMKHVAQGRAGALVEQGTKDLRARVGLGPVIRPFLQAFDSGADYYNPDFMTEQIRGARNGQSDGFLFWHPGSRYGLVRASMQGAAQSLCPFPGDARREFRARKAAADGPQVPPSPAVAGAPRDKPAS